MVVRRSPGCGLTNLRPGYVSVRAMNGVRTQVRTNGIQYARTTTLNSNLRVECELEDDYRGKYNVCRSPR